MSMLNHTKFKIDQAQVDSDEPLLVEFQSNWIRFPNDDPSFGFDHNDEAPAEGNPRSVPIGWLEFCEALKPGQWAMGTVLKRGYLLRYVGAHYKNGTVTCGIETSPQLTFTMTPTKIRVYDEDFNVVRKVYEPFQYGLTRQRAWRVTQAYTYQRYQTMMVPYYMEQAIEHFNKMFARFLPHGVGPDRRQILGRDWWVSHVFPQDETLYDSNTVTPAYFEQFMQIYDDYLRVAGGSTPFPAITTLNDASDMTRGIVNRCRLAAGLEPMPFTSRVNVASLRRKLDVAAK